MGPTISTDSDIVESDDSMELGHDSQRIREKRGNNYPATRAKKVRSCGGKGGEIEERTQEGLECKIIL